MNPSETTRVACPNYSGTMSVTLTLTLTLTLTPTLTLNLYRSRC